MQQMLQKMIWQMTEQITKGVQEVREYAAKEQSEVFVVCAQIEQEIAELDDDEKKMFLEDLGLTESGLEKLIKASYKLARTDQLSDSRRAGSPCMDDYKRNKSTAGSR